MTAWDKAIEMAAALGKAPAGQLLDRNASLMVRERRRILMALFPSGSWTWPHPFLTTVELLTLARDLQRQPDWAGISAVDCAVEALTRMIAAGARAEAA